MRARVRVAAALAAATLTACGGSEPNGGERERPAGGRLGGSAATENLARGRLARRPAEPVAWVAYELRSQRGRPLRHMHEPAFVYASSGENRLTAGGRERELAAGSGAALLAGERHTHSGDGIIWEIRLARPGAGPPPGATGARRVFESERLRGIPAKPLASFIEVSLPPRGGMTTVHTHPGPEFIYQLSGRIQYQNALIGTKPLGPGGAEAIPPNTAVQKRNPARDEASFLSWFLVDPDRPFAPEARFER